MIRSHAAGAIEPRNPIVSKLRAGDLQASESTTQFSTASARPAAPGSATDEE